jgi:O-antigen ligase
MRSFSAWLLPWWAWALIALLLFAGVGLAAFMLPTNLFLAMLAAWIVVLVWLVFPDVVIGGLLLFRSSADAIMELFTLFPGSALSMNLSGATNSLAVGLGVLAVARRVVRRQPLFVASPGWTYALFLLVCLISIPGSVDPALGIKEWARLASGLAIYLMVADVVRDERRARRMIAIILASSLIPLALGWLQALTGSGYFFLGAVGTEFEFRPNSTFAHPSALGSYLVILLTLAAGLYFSETSTRVRTALLVWAGLAAGLLVLAMARTQWLGMIVAALVVGLLKRRRLAFLTLAVALVLLVSVPLLQERLLASHSVGWRIDLWQAGLQLFWPLSLLGHGLATSPWHINWLLPKVNSPPHNDYLKVGIELGILGLATYGLWVVAMLRHNWRAYRRASGEYPRAESRSISWRALSMLAIVVAGVVMSMTDNHLGHTAVQWYLWALLALVPPDGRWESQAGD